MPVSLGKLVLFTTTMASGGCALVYYLVQKTFSRASYYQSALEQLHSHSEALEALGIPLKIHYLHLTDKYNFMDIAYAQVMCSPSKLQARCLVKEKKRLP